LGRDDKRARESDGNFQLNKRAQLSDMSQKGRFGDTLS
jgi:hypothetical protein